MDDKKHLQMKYVCMLINTNMSSVRISAIVQTVSSNMSLNGTNCMEKYVTKWYKLYRGICH